MSINLTLNYIKSRWSGATDLMDRVSFCLAVLPDCYDPQLCQDQGSHFFNKLHSSPLANSTINSLMRGNRKSSNDLTCASVAFTKDLLMKLQRNEEIHYLDPHRPPTRCVDNMLAKIREMIHRYGTPLDGKHPLFTDADFRPLADCDEALGTCFRKMYFAVTTLRGRETVYSLGYAIFLLVITAILQNHIAAVEHLYNPNTIQQILDSDEDAPLLEVDSRAHIPFTDPHYMDVYNVYFYWETSHIRILRGTLTLLTNENQRPTAVLNIHSDISNPFTDHLMITRIYSGMPMLNKIDGMVYIPMTDNRGSMLYLTFPYTRFNFAPMYYRAGTLISRDSETGYPQVQKVAITAREITDEELPYIQGLLRTGGKRILMSQQQLDLFCEKFQDYPWMKDFEKNYMPIFQTHQLSFYCFNEDELLACSASSLPYDQRLKLMLALKSVSPPNDPSLDKILRTAPPSKTYAMMK